MTRRDHMGGVLTAMFIGWILGATFGPLIGQWLETCLR